MDEITEFISKIMPYELKNGAWTVDEVSGMVNTAILKYLLKQKLVEVVDKSINPRYHTTDKASKYFKVEQKTNEIPSNLFDSIVGHDNVKELIYMALHATEPVHIGLLGKSSSAKSLILYSLERLPNSLYVDSSIATKMGVGKLLETHKPKYLLMDEFDKMNADDYNVLLTVMSSGRYVATKAHGRVDIPMKTWVFAAMNTLNIPVTIRERFLTIIKLPEYDKRDAMIVIESILKHNKVVEPALAAYIARKVTDEIGVRNPRVALQLARMCKTKEDVDRAVELINANIRGQR